MGGRGASSGSSKSLSTGDKTLDKIVNDALKRHKDDEVKNKLQENIAKRVLNATSNDPVAEYKDRMRQLSENNDRNLREIADFKKETKRLEKSISREEALLKSYSKETRVVTDVRGNKLTTNSERYETQARKTQMLNESYRKHLQTHSAKKKAVESFNKMFKEEAESGARRAMLAKNYKKKR